MISLWTDAFRFNIPSSGEGDINGIYGAWSSNRKKLLDAKTASNWNLNRRPSAVHNSAVRSYQH